MLSKGKRGTGAWPFVLCWLAVCTYAVSPCVAGSFCAACSTIRLISGNLNGDGNLALQLQAAISNPCGYRGEVTSIANLFVYFVSEAKNDPTPRPTRGKHTRQHKTRFIQAMANYHKRKIGTEELAGCNCQIAFLLKSKKPIDEVGWESLR